MKKSQLASNKLAIIPARGGSKRIPKKNIKLFFGKPIIAYSIETALNSGLFDEVMVSTDNEDIAEVALSYGAKVPFYRSKKNSDDYASTMDVVHEVLDSYEEKFNQKFSYVCCIYPAAPLIQPKHLQRGFEELAGKNLKTVFPVVAFGHPVWRGVEIVEGGMAQMVWPENVNTRSQDLKQIYHDAGQWYWIDVKSITNKLITDKSGVIVMSELEVQDIDSASDWAMAELKYSLYNNNTHERL